jgi:hypothetical protein
MGTEIDGLQWLASLGVGGALAGGMFLIYRKDSKASEERWKGQSEMLVQVVKENTTAITSLTDRLNR